MAELDVAAGAANATAWIRERVYQSFEDSPLGQIASLMQVLAPVGPGSEVSADAVFDDGVRPRADEWARFAAACEALQRREAA